MVGIRIVSCIIFFSIASNILVIMAHIPLSWKNQLSMDFVENPGVAKNGSLHLLHSTRPCVSKTRDFSQIMALVLIKSNSAGFCVQIYSQNRVAVLLHQTGGL